MKAMNPDMCTHILGSACIAVMRMLILYQLMKITHYANEATHLEQFSYYLNLNLFSNPS